MLPIENFRKFLITLEMCNFTTIFFLKLTLKKYINAFLKTVLSNIDGVVKIIDVFHQLNAVYLYFKK